MRHFAIASFLLVTAALGWEASAATNDRPSGPHPAVVTKILDLFDRLRAAQEGDHQAVSFSLSETEINEYLRYSLKSTPRPGVESVTMKFFAKDYLSTYTRVDFEALEQWRPGTIPTVLRPFLKGKKAIWIDFRIKAEDSNMTFTVEKARYEEMALPPVFVTKLIQVVAAQQPEHYDTSKPMPIPFGLRRVKTEEHIIKGNN